MDYNATSSCYALPTAGILQILFIPYKSTQQTKGEFAAVGTGEMEGTMGSEKKRLIS